MACFHPLDAYGFPQNGADKMKIVFCRPGMKEPSEEHLKKEGIKKLKIPCGQCVGCRLEYSRQWAVRCYLEAKQWKHNYFVTLTYNNECVPLKPKSISSDGEVVDGSLVMTLVPKHITGFMKRLRRRFEYEYSHTGIRFFACGEYGPLNMRPHYHLILFNCPIPDLEIKFCRDGYTYYTSKLLDSVWSLPDDSGNIVQAGHVVVTDFSFETAAYVARYMLKKHKGKDNDFYAKEGIAPEFTRSSRRPGIASKYYEDNSEQIYEFDKVVITNGKGKPIKCQPPRYYDRLFDVDNPYILAIIKEKRSSAALRSMDVQLQSTDLPESMYLEVKENNKLLSIRSLKRTL